MNHVFASFILLFICSSCGLEAHIVEYDPKNSTMKIQNEDWFIYEITFYTESSVVLLNILNEKFNPNDNIIYLDSCINYNCTGTYSNVKSFGECYGSVVIMKKSNIESMRRIDFKIVGNSSKLQLFKFKRQ